MKISVGTLLKTYQVEGTVLVSVRIFVNKMNSYRLKKMKRKSRRLNVGKS